MPLVFATIPCYPLVKCIIIIIIIIMHMHVHVHMHAHMRMCACACICALRIWYLKFCQGFIFTAQLARPSPSAVNSTSASGTSFHFSSRSCMTISDGCHPCCHSTTSLFSEVRQLRTLYRSPYVGLRAQFQNVFISTELIINFFEHQASVVRLHSLYDHQVYMGILHLKFSSNP